MKKLFLAALCSIFAFSGFSQVGPSFQFGAKGGLNIAKFKTDGTLFDTENRGGYYGGLWMRIGAGGLHLQPEVYLSGKNSSFITLTGQENKVEFTSLDVPVLVGTKLGTADFGLRLNTGPVFTFVLDEQQKFAQAASDVFDGKFKHTAIAWQFGLGFDIGKLSIDGRYESGLSEINSAMGYPTTKLNLYTLGIGFRIF